MVSVGVAPAKGSRPVAISYSATPRLNRSLRGSNSRPSTCSGLMYGSDPITIPTAVPASVVNWPSAVNGSPRAVFAIPKSSTLTWPRGVNIRLAGLMSRCVMPLACAASSASATCEPMSRISVVVIGRPAIFSARVCPSTYSMTMKRSAVVFANVMDGGDVRMIQGRRRPGLSRKSVQAVGIEGQIGRQDFQGHRAVQPGIPGQIDLAHAASSQERLHLVVAERPADEPGLAIRAQALAPSPPRAGDSMKESAAAS